MRPWIWETRNTYLVVHVHLVCEFNLRAKPPVHQIHRLPPAPQQKHTGVELRVARIGSLSEFVKSSPSRFEPENAIAGNQDFGVFRLDCKKSVSLVWANSRPGLVNTTRTWPDLKYFAGELSQTTSTSEIKTSNPAFSNANKAVVFTMPILLNTCFRSRWPMNTLLSSVGLVNVSTSISADASRTRMFFPTHLGLTRKCQSLVMCMRDWYE